jgi:integrase
MRLNEIKTLEWSQVKWAEGVLILYKTKNGRPRRVPLQGQAFIELRSYSKVRRIDSKLVFPSLNDSKRPTDIRWAWEKALEKAEILDFRFHDLRHTAASYFAMSGASARDLCEIFGWETMQMAMRYAHLFDSHTVEIAGRMSERFIEGK